MDNRDMYYNTYGYGGFTPTNNMHPQLPPMMNQQMPTSIPTNNYSSSQFNDMSERINRLERQIKRLDQRLTRLETPYANNNFLNNEPDNNMYMM